MVYIYMYVLYMYAHSHVCNGVAAERKAQGPDMHRVQHSQLLQEDLEAANKAIFQDWKRNQTGHGLLRSPQCCESEIIRSSVPRQKTRVEILGLYNLHRTRKLVVPSGWRSISFGVLHLTSQAVKEGRVDALKDTQPKGYQCQRAKGKSKQQNYPPELMSENKARFLIVITIQARWCGARL